MSLYKSTGSAAGRTRLAVERVLVMEDSLVYRDLIVNHILKPNGYETLTATDGQEGLSVALQEKPDLIITDLRMPELDGIEVLEALKEAGQDIPVILMTLHGSEDLVVQAFRLGAKDYVIKPFNVEEMLAAIDRALTEARLRRERDALTQDLMYLNQELEAERRRFEAVLTYSEDVVLLVGDDPLDRVILANQAARDALDIGENAVGQPLTEVLHDEILLAAFGQAETSGQSVQTEITLSDERTLNVHVTPIPGVGQVAVMQDISDLKELDRIKTELVATVSHDLRSPLTSIKGFADLLPMAGELNEKQMSFLHKIQRGVESVTEMVSDLLDLGRIEAEARMEMEPCDLGAIIEKTAASLESAAELRKQHLKLDLEPDLPPVLGNPMRLSQVINNLVGNAIKYTPDEGHIIVSATADQGQVIVTIEDNGIGIPASELPHIFEKFYRVKSPETDDIIGSGLGLSLVKSIVDKHDGRIWVQSQIGKGSAFTIVLLAADERQLARPGTKTTAPLDGTHNEVVEFMTTLD
jgi:signal transduction histidine kinase